MTSPDEPKPEPPAKPEEAESSTGRRVLIAVGAAVVALGAAYGTGRYQGKLTTDAAEKQASEREAEKKRATVEFDAQRDRAIRLEARRRLHLALLALEERNFGLAEGHLAKASALLGRAKGDAALERLAGEIGGTKLGATDDLGATRKKLLDWVQAFDAAMPLPE